MSKMFKKIAENVPHKKYTGFGNQSHYVLAIFAILRMRLSFYVLDNR